MSFMRRTDSVKGAVAFQALPLGTQVARELRKGLRYDGGDRLQARARFSTAPLSGERDVLWNGSSAQSAPHGTQMMPRA
jgi:hypothetical protein